jgi:hypothetical protein
MPEFPKQPEKVSIMGHHISAIIAKLPVDLAAAAQFDLPVYIECGFAIIALDPEHADYWQQSLHILDSQDSAIILDCAVTHYFARHIGLSRYTIIETDYAGGAGTQAAVVYENQEIIMPPTHGGINAALALLGVQRSETRDEFDMLNLGEYRNVRERFEKYRGISQQ